MWTVARLEPVGHHVRKPEQVAHHADDFDILHFHSEPIPLPLIRRLQCTYVTTMHGLLHPCDQVHYCASLLTHR